MYRQPPQFREAIRDWRWLACALLLVAAQLLLAVHAVEHVGGDDDGTCEICLIGGGLDHAAIDSVPAVPAAGAVPVVTAPPIYTHIHRPSSPFRQRAPPLHTRTA